MSTLILFRHAKAEHHSASGTDFDRGLRQSGILQARAQGAWLSEELADQDDIVCLCSSAQRAQQTLAESGLGHKVRTTLVDEIYNATAGQLIQILERRQGTSCILMIGHNPGFSDLASVLSGTYSPLKTASVATLQMAERDDWLQPGSAQSISVRHP